MTRASSNPKHEGWDLPPPSEDLPDNLKVVDLPIPVPSPPRKDSTTAAAAAAAAAYNDFTLFSISKESADRQMEINWYLRFRTLELNKWIARLFASSIAAIFIVNAIVQISTPRARMWPTVDWTGTCKLVWEFVPAWLYAGSFLGLGCPILLWRLRNTKDPHLVLVDVYICLVVGLPIALASLAWGLFIDSQFPTSFGAGSMFLVFATVTGHLTSVIMPLMRAFGDERRKRERRILQNMENFMMVLHDPITSGEFEQYTIGDSCVELMIFFQEWQELQRQARALLFANTGYNPTSSQISNQDLSNQSIQSHYSLSQQSQPPLISRFKSLLHTGGASDEDLEWDGGATGFRKNTSTTVTTEASTNPGGTGTSESRPSSPLLPNSTVGSVYQSVSAGSVLPVRSASIMDFIRKAASDRYSAASFMGLPYSAPPGGPSVSATPSGQRLPDGSLSGIGSPPPTLEALVAMSPVPKPIIPLYLGFFQMFVKPDASMAVNCAHNVVQEVVQCVERKELTVGMFNKVKDEVVRNLYLNCFPGFLQSQRARGFYLAPPNLINAPKDLA
ncbi:hypothetical protein DFS34DRAFT_599730 [Phlyctochytrium arcticum]|nr:hypothetical protein DFS34DRAFT_599730 [Phlyctochytrium arcticum]